MTQTGRRPSDDYSAQPLSAKGFKKTKQVIDETFSSLTIDGTPVNEALSQRYGDAIHLIQ